MKKSLLLTGSTGYIGQNLLRVLSRHPAWEILCAERSSGFDLSVTDWTINLPEHGTDVVIHLAQSRQYREFPSGAMDTFRVNVAGTFELLEWARTHGVKRFIFASTGTVYTPMAGKLAETAQCAPSSMYAATKLSAEDLIQPYSSFFEIVIARLFGIYGAGQRNMLIPDMIERVGTGQEICLAGGLGIYITPLYVEDCVKVLITLAQAPLEKRVNILNIAGDEVLSLREIVEVIAERLKKQPVIKSTHEQPKHLCGDNTLLRKLYRDAFVPFADGIELTLRDGRLL